eukprot:440796-Amphidinium_carterae.1
MKAMHFNTMVQGEHSGGCKLAYLRVGGNWKGWFTSHVSAPTGFCWQRKMGPALDLTQRFQCIE